MTIRKLHDMTWKEVDDLDRSKALVILPIGSIEQHGPHLPLGMDILVAEAVLDMALENVEDKYEILVMPAFPIGQSPEHMDFPGTITLTAQTIITVIKEICSGLTRHGFKKILIVNGHGGNIANIGAAGFDIRNEQGLITFMFNAWALIPGLGPDVVKREADARSESHGGEIETSIMLALDPSLVHMEWAIDEENPQLKKGKFVAMGGPVDFSWNAMLDHAPSGISGEPSFGSVEKGEAIMKYLAHTLSRGILEIMQNW